MSEFSLEQLAEIEAKYFALIALNGPACISKDWKQTSGLKGASPDMYQWKCFALKSDNRIRCRLYTNGMIEVYCLNVFKSEAAVLANQQKARVREMQATVDRMALQRILN